MLEYRILNFLNVIQNNKKKKTTRCHNVYDLSNDVSYTLRIYLPRKLGSSRSRCTKSTYKFDDKKFTKIFVLGFILYVHYIWGCVGPCV